MWLLPESSVYMDAWEQLILGVRRSDLTDDESALPQGGALSSHLGEGAYWLAHSCVHPVVPSVNCVVPT